MSGATASGSEPLRTRVYIDGYNLYYGCLKGTPYKWLDLMTLFERHILPSSAPQPSVLLPQAIKFFTAKILEPAAKALDSVSSQARYHTALRKLYHERIQLIEGYYSLSQVKARLVDDVEPNKWARNCAQTLVWKLEEKQSDVNLALQAYHDAITGDVDQVVIVTNDTDIAPALHMIRTYTGVKIGVVVPASPSCENLILAWSNWHIGPEPILPNKSWLGRNCPALSWEGKPRQSSPIPGMPAQTCWSGFWSALPMFCAPAARPSSGFRNRASTLVTWRLWTCSTMTRVPTAYFAISMTMSKVVCAIEYAHDLTCLPSCLYVNEPSDR